MDISINDIGLSIDGNSSNDYINSENLLAFEITNNDLKFESDLPWYSKSFISDSNDNGIL